MPVVIFEAAFVEFTGRLDQQPIALFAVLLI